MDLEQLAADLHRRLDGTTAAREQALPAARRSIRASANSIRAIHRLEFDRAAVLIEESRAALRDGIEDAPFLNGMAEAIGEARRRVLDLLRTREVDEGERLLGEMEDMYGLLVTIDYPDAVTLNLRRSTDVARSLIEKTRGDLSIAFVQRDLHDALERHTSVSWSVTRVRATRPWRSGCEPAAGRSMGKPAKPSMAVCSRRRQVR